MFLKILVNNVFLSCLSNVKVMFFLNYMNIVNESLHN